MAGSIRGLLQRRGLGEIFDIQFTEMKTNITLNLFFNIVKPSKSKVMNKIINLFRKILIAVFLLQNFTLAAQHDFDSLYNSDPVFTDVVKNINDTLDFYSSDKVLKLTIESDYKNLQKNKTDREYQKAILKYQLNDTVLLSRKIKIKPRGNFRLNNCYYPPLKINFPKKDAKLKMIREFDKLKMVVQCKGGRSFENYLLGEYLAYKLYNILTDYSFRVRLLKVRYVDTGSKKKPIDSYAFIIEDIDNLAKRVNGVEIETKHIGDKFLFRDQSALLFLFEYFIGNTDWSIPGLHNIKLIKPNDHTKTQVYVIPYDFDYSGIINATYAIPHEMLDIKTVRERLYRGYCRTPEEWQRVVNIFNDKKEDIYALYRQSGLLDKYDLKSTLNYIDSFYETINTPNAFKREIINNCR